MLVGCGPHSKRVYLPALKNLSNRYNIRLKLVVELEKQRLATSGEVKQFFSNVYFLFTKPSKNPYILPADFKKQLDSAVNHYKINGIIIATEPLSHMQYALWAIDKGLHVLMDKPISTHKNISNSTIMANKLTSDYTLLTNKRDTTKAFIVNAQRRYHPGFQYALTQIKEIAQEFRIPITGMQSTHCDGQWRLPKEVLTQEYHPYIGYGKVSHSGYHLIDLISHFIQNSFISSNKSFDKIGVYSSFVQPTGLLSQQNRRDYLKIFGEQYKKVNEFSDQQLSNLYKAANEAEVDSSSLITLFNKDHPTANISLNLLHNGFSRRNSILPGNDLYKGNGRVKHEHHSIQQGPYQNIQIHSYQASDKHEINTENDYDLGGNNHFDIYIFRNSGILGGEPLQIIQSKDLRAQIDQDNTKLFIEQVKHRVVQEFIEIMAGQRIPTKTHSDLSAHFFSTNLMSLIYKSGIKRKEVTASYAH